LTHASGATAWLEGWNMPLEKAIDEVILSEAASTSG
jgi:hypothetical protein